MLNQDNKNIKGKAIYIYICIYTQQLYNVVHMYTPHQQNKQYKNKTKKYTLHNTKPYQFLIMHIYSVQQTMYKTNR